MSLADPNELMRSVYDASESSKLLAESGVGGIKVRINPYRHYTNVDSREHFVHVFANIMQGRPQPDVLGSRQLLLTPTKLGSMDGEVVLPHSALKVSPVVEVMLGLDNRHFQRALQVRHRGDQVECLVKVLRHIRPEM